MENNKKTKIVFRNPCKNCIVKVTCKKDCNNFDSYESTCENICLSIALTIGVFLVILLSVCFFKLNINKWAKIILFTIALVVIYVHYTIKLIKEASSDFKDASIFFQIFVFIFNPIAEELCKVVDHFNLDDKLSDFIHRYRI